MHKGILAWACALLFAGASYAQTAGVVTLRANQTTAQGSLVPVLTWSTNPVAARCQASGGWSGTKAASGTQTLASINASTNYTLTCTWGTGSSTVVWTPPTANTDGSALTDLARFKVLYGTSATSLTRTVVVDDPTRRQTVISSLAPGTWYFAVRAVKSNGVESTNSNVASKAVTGATAARTVSITITQPTGTLRTTSTNVWDVVRRADGGYARIGVVGQIALGRPCDASFKAAVSHYAVSRTYVTLYKTPASTQLVAYCERS
jgi:hypothetical protein